MASSAAGKGGPDLGDRHNQVSLRFRCQNESIVTVVTAVGQSTVGEIAVVDLIPFSHQLENPSRGPTRHL